MFRQAKTTKERSEMAKIIRNSMKDCALSYERAEVPAQEIKAALCSPVDLRPKMGPIRNQDGVGWCYAFAAADMMTFKTGQNPRVSAAEIASQYIATETKNQTSKSVAWLSDKRYDGGYIHRALGLVAQNGICSEKQIPSEVNAGPAISQAYHDLYASAYYKTQYAHASLCDTMAAKYRKFFPSIAPAEILRILNTEAPQHVVQTLQQRSCPQKKASPIQPGNVGIEPDQTKFAETLEREMDQGEPLGLGYRVELIVANNQGALAQNHAGTIVGRKFDAKSGKCQYLLRNTWGRSCDGYRKWPCDAGNLWITEEHLIAYSNSVTYFK